MGGIYLKNKKIDKSDIFSFLLGFITSFVIVAGIGFAILLLK